MPLSIAAVSIPIPGQHTFVNESDMPINVSVTYVACEYDNHTIPAKGAVDKQGKSLTKNSWTTPANICCVKRVDFRDADSNTFLQANDNNLRIVIDNVSNAKLRDAVLGTIGTIGVTAGFVAAGAIMAAAPEAAFLAAGPLAGLPTAGLELGTATSELIKNNVHPVIECSANSKWYYGGAKGSYRLVGPQGYVWDINIPERMPNTTPNQQAKSSNSRTKR